MKLPSICYNKFLWLAIGASFSFTTIMFDVTSDTVREVKADYVHKIDQIDATIADNQIKINKISEDTQYIKGKLDVLIERP